MSRKIAFRTLGCRLNQYETDALASTFKNNDYKIVDYNDKADVYVVNTCTVTKQSDTKSRNIIRQATKTNEDALVVVTGCMVNNHRDKLEQSLDNVTYFVENEEKSQIYNLIDAHYKGEVYHPKRDSANLFNYDAAKHTFHTRSMIKIQDGCDNFCTFCIIPSVRGRAKSRPYEDIEENIRKVVGYGYKEIVLTGVNIGRYHYNGMKFDDLIERVLEIPGDFRVRISSIEPDGFGKKLYQLFRHPKLAPHLHLCLQSGSDKTLLKMRRMYTVDEFRQIVNDVRAVRPDFNFTTDVIVGFPGETEEDFNETVNVVKELGFSHIHTFKYSMREGTRAARMKEHLPDKLKSQRSEIIRDLTADNKLNYRKSFIGKQQRVLVEKIDKEGYAHGYGEHYIPVKFAGDNLKKNEFYDVDLKDIEEGDEPVMIGLARVEEKV
ncbi:MAG: tRNA (N(6)-L-threonylcarbamoyladenosine(37)-C(2))-methylthiotransferase MtaB [Bacteroidales bacterium]|nr:tRNA (N(6)-L-threonylcarbamoyladenosine(37)-C(2))-methylthiotransferase MtaB [Bacteroidales bacterium]MCF8336634.1 tRNA (N(6)-L-threonylcarbamoyladenosine(37)-C(2))-methylthiotransferase MtaB [Bacteroidales bacterium]